MKHTIAHCGKMSCFVVLQDVFREHSYYWALKLFKGHRSPELDARVLEQASGYVNKLWYSYQLAVKLHQRYKLCSRRDTPRDTMLKRYPSELCTEHWSASGRRSGVLSITCWLKQQQHETVSFEIHFEGSWMLLTTLQHFIAECIAKCIYLSGGFGS